MRPSWMQWAVVVYNSIRMARRCRFHTSQVRTSFEAPNYHYLYTHAQRGGSRTAFMIKLRSTWVVVFIPFVYLVCIPFKFLVSGLSRSFLDIKVKEPNLEAMARGRIRYDPPRYMTVNVALRQWLECESIRGGGGRSLLLWYSENISCRPFPQC